MRKLHQLKERILSGEGRIGYLVLWMIGVPIPLLLILWLIFGNNIIAKG